MTIEWGRDIQCKGSRPAWIADSDQIFMVPAGYSRPAGLLTWRDYDLYRLPAEHFAYKALDEGFEPWGGGTEVPCDWDGGEVLWRDGRRVAHCDDWKWGKTHPHDPSSTEGWDVIGYHKKENTMTNERPTAEQTQPQPAPPETHITDERDRLMQEIAQARAQRDMAGQAAAHWIGRYYALRTAHGDIPALNVTPLVERELQALEAAANPQQSA